MFMCLIRWTLSSHYKKIPWLKPDQDCVDDSS